MLVDVHAHLDFKDFSSDLPEVIQRCKDANVSFVICNGVDLDANKKILELSREFPIIRPAFGLYPLDAIKMSDEEIEKTFLFIEKHVDECIAFGEIGLDYTDISNVDKQKEVLLRFFSLAKKYDKPVILHSRKAEKDVLQMVLDAQLKKVNLHCFSGKFSLVKQIEENGFFMSIPPIIGHSGHFQKMAKEVSLKCLLTETDSPFLSYEKGKRNEPKNVSFTIKKIAEIRALDEEEVQKIIFLNAQKLFSK